jgi:hypothetical protein
MIQPHRTRRGVIPFYHSGYGNLRPACGTKILQYSSVGREEPRGYRRPSTHRLRYGGYDCSTDRSRTVASSVTPVKAEKAAQPVAM